MEMTYISAENVVLYILFRILNERGKGMNYKEALKEITYQLKDVGDYDVVYWDCVPTAILEICVKTLEKQIPKKPCFEGDGYADGKLVYDTWICPCCGKDYEVDYDKHKHCPECGQAIDWEVKE
jgi:hypothetical protein